MCIVSDTSLKELLFSEEMYGDAKKWFAERDWASIKGRILIHPFNIKNLGPFSYDLCIGGEAFAISRKRRISLDEEEEAMIEPGDVSLVPTQEFIGLPRDFAASVMPRFSFVREGIIQSMAKIDPTWFGKIVVALTNHSRKPFQLRQGHPFCTLIIRRLDKPCSRVLSSRDTPALGKESIEYFLKRK